jgi:hypothetical protein
MMSPKLQACAIGGDVTAIERCGNRATVKLREIQVSQTLVIERDFPQLGGR